MSHSFFNVMFLGFIHRSAFVPDRSYSPFEHAAAARYPIEHAEVLFNRIGIAKGTAAWHV